MTVLVCYLDDSDAAISKVITIAGYVAQTAGWSRVEDSANAICDAYGVDLIRGRELDGRHGCFKGWPHPKIERFLEEIGEAMAGNVLFGISRSIGKEYYKLRKLKLGLNPNLSAFGFCFGTISFSLKTEEPLGLVEQVNREGVAYKIEAGHKNNGDILRYVDQERQHGNLHQNTTVDEVDKRSSRAVQIADLYAFYSRRKANKYARFKGKLEFVPDIHQIHVQPKISHYSGYIEEPYRSAINVLTGEHLTYVVGLADGF